MIFSAGLLLLLLKTCQAEYECYYTDGTTRYCEECCEYDCCEGGLSGGAIAGIIIAVIAVLALKVCCICMRVRRRTTVITRTVNVPRSIVVATNTNHAGYDQRIPTIHQPNPNHRAIPVVQQANPNHHGYDQQKPEFAPMPPPPPYETVMKEAAK